MKRFRRDYGVYCCSHVFSDQRPVLLVIRDPDGDWQFLCGNSEENEDCHLVGIGHLLDRDPSLGQMAELMVSSGAERKDISASWEMFSLDE